MKINPYLLISLPGLLPMHSVFAADLSVGVSISELESPIETSKPELDLSSQNKSLQLSYNLHDWVVGFALSQADNDKTFAFNKLVEKANFDQTSSEIYTSYYLNEWVFSVALGSSDLDYQLLSQVTQPTLRNPIVQQEVLQTESYQNQFIEISAGYWFDLNDLVENFSINVDTSIAKYDSNISQRSSTYLNQLDESDALTEYLQNNGLSLGLQLDSTTSLNPKDEIFSISATANYGFNLLQLEWYSSVWISQEWSDAQSGVISFSRSRNGRTINRTLSSVDDFTDDNSTTTYTNYGFSLEVNLTENLSLSASLFGDETSSMLWQAGGFYYF